MSALRVPAADERPATFAQAYELLSSADGTAGVNAAIGARVLGPIDHAAVQRAVDAVVQRHEALRSSLALRDGEVTQRVEPVRLTVAHHRLDRLRRHDWPHALRDVIAADVAQPISLTRTPMVGAHLVEVGEDDHMIVWTFPHTIVDAFAAELLVVELTELYLGLVAGKDPELPVASQISDLARRQHAEARQATGESITDLAVRAIADAGDAPHVLTGYEVELGDRAARSAFADAITWLAQQAGTSVGEAAVALAAQAALRHGDDDAITASVLHANRAWPGARSILGNVFDVAPVRFERHDDGAAAARQAREAVRETLATRSSGRLLLAQRGGPCATAINVVRLPRFPRRLGIDARGRQILIARYDNTDLPAVAFPSGGEWYGAHVVVNLYLKPDKGLSCLIGYDANGVAPDHVAGLGEVLAGALRRLGDEAQASGMIAAPSDPPQDQPNG